MPVLEQPWINRTHLRDNRDWLYLFGDNEVRWGRAGQAKQCRGELNAIGVATKQSPYRYWSDKDYDRATAIIQVDLEPAFACVKNGGTVVIPRDGLGTGLAELPTRAPRIFAFLQNKLSELKAIANTEIAKTEKSHAGA
jgi:hypothetical protein